MKDFALYWNEQYLPQAFLAHNASWDVLVAAEALRRTRRSELDRVPSCHGAQRGKLLDASRSLRDAAVIHMLRGP
jgi:hypothetical protein